MSESAPTRVRVWDVPTRIVHWSMVLLFAFSWWTAENGELEWHRWSGYSLTALVLFRLYWGFFGGSTARFAQFLRGPRAVVSYLRGASIAVPGHNPIGAWSVVFMLALLATQIVLGLFAVDVDGLESGPLSSLVSFDTGRTAAHWHETIFNVLLAVIGLHILAAHYYLVVRKQNLIGAMFTGHRHLDGSQPSLVPASIVRLILGILIAAALTWFISRE
ncbi:MAG: cytochrome b/b6 domain-containing protein [Steroidobacteraceae bacterium]|nr:cytochrome b/b6 domain-containing protein [Steroidobacteraceae bacterium]